MRQDTEHSAGRCIGKINAFWRKLGVASGAHIGRNGEIQSGLTDGLPAVRLPMATIARANAASGAFKERVRG